MDQTIKEIEEIGTICRISRKERMLLNGLIFVNLIHTMEWVANPGRNMKFWVKDRSTEKILGQICIGSDVTSIKVRDHYIGWTKKDKFDNHRLNNTCIATTIVSTQPGRI